MINSKLNIRRSLCRDIRVKLHKLECGNTTVNKKELIGKISFMRFVRTKEDIITNLYCKRLNRLMEPLFPDADFRLNLKNAFDKYVVRIEGSDINGCSPYYGSGFFAKGYLITSRHVVELEKTDSFSGLRGYFRKLTISYYDDSNCFKETTVGVLDAFYFGEIAFLRIDKIDLFKTKFLKVSNPLTSNPDQAYCCGCQISDISGLGIQFAKRQIIGNNTYHDSHGFTLQRGSILKGMSGAPLIDINSFSVIGVNFEGHESGDVNRHNSVASTFNNSSFKEMKQWIPDELWLLKHTEWK